MILSPLRDTLRYDSAFWRKLAWYGSARGPLWWVRGSPPVLGLLFAAILPQYRRYVRRNLRALRGPQSPVLENAAVARTFMDYAETLADRLALSEGERFQPTVEVRGHEHAEYALSLGKGMIAATAHTAGWETALSALRTRVDRRVCVVMHPERDEEARELHNRYRESLGLEIVHAGVDPLSSLPLLRNLRQGGVVAVQIDRCPPGMRGKILPLPCGFFQMPQGPFLLASLTGAPVVPVFSCRVGFLSYRLEVGEPIRVEKRATDQALRSPMMQVLTQLESFLIRHPTQWFHFVE